MKFSHTLYIPPYTEGPWQRRGLLHFTKRIYNISSLPTISSNINGLWIHLISPVAVSSSFTGLHSQVPDSMCRSGSRMGKICDSGIVKGMIFFNCRRGKSLKIPVSLSPSGFFYYFYQLIQFKGRNLLWISIFPLSQYSENPIR